MSREECLKTGPSADARETRMDTLIGYVLVGGVTLCVLLIVAGIAWHWIRTGHAEVRYPIARMNLFEFVVADVQQVASGEFRPRLLVSLGIAALLLTPYLRVTVSLAFFALAERNWKYSLFTGFVLAVLTYSLFVR